MITRYVNTASTAGGDGTTNATIGESRAWATLMEAMTALNASPVSDDIQVLCCGSAADTVNANNWGSWTTSTSYSMAIRGNPDHANGAHEGIWSADRYRIQCNTASKACIENGLFTSRIFIVEGIQIYQESDTRHAISFGSYALSGSKIRNCILRTVNIKGYDHFGTVDVENCVFQVDTPNSSYGIQTNASGISVVNCMFVNWAVPVARFNGTVYVTNCTRVNTGGFVGLGIVVDHCATSNGEGTNPIPISNWDDEFHNSSYVSELDFRMSIDSHLRGAGVGPSVDSDVPTDDIIGETRSGSSSSVGVYENQYKTYAFPANPYDGQEHRTVSGSLYVYHSDRSVWMKANTEGKGVTGAVGVTGSSTPGAQGETGIQGDTGAQGDTGTLGVTGVGITGNVGVTGAQAPTGPQGVTGPDPGVTGFLNFVMNNPSTGIGGQMQMPYDLHIDSWEMVSSDGTTIRADLRIGPFSAWPPAFSMNGSATGPHIGAAFKNADYDLSDWAGTTGAAGDWMQMDVVESDSPESVTVALGYHQV